MSVVGGLVQRRHVGPSDYHWQVVLISFWPPPTVSGRQAARHIVLKKSWLCSSRQCSLPPSRMGRLALIYLVLLHSFLQLPCSLNVCPSMPVVAAATHQDVCFESPIFKNLKSEGKLSFSNLASAASDYGNVVSKLPAAILYPSTPNDIQDVLKAVYASEDSKMTVAARGAGHSIFGQAMTRSGVVVAMSHLVSSIEIHRGPCGSLSYADVGGGELWVNLLKATLKVGLAPRSWTDYLHLTVGGTLSNAGISGQTFRHGPQISNVLQLEVVTGSGELVTCSATRNSKLFKGALGGLGQFGIITRARIILEPAPSRVRWIRAVYSDFAKFSKDQESLIALPDNHVPCDYVEGFVVLNNNGTANGYNSIPFGGNSVDPARVPESAGAVLYTIELGINYREDEEQTSVDERAAAVLASLHYIPGLVFTSDVSYFDFLERVHTIEEELRLAGLWTVPHPWLNLFVPAKSMPLLNKAVFSKLREGSLNGPLLVYPVNKKKWISSSSAVLPKGSKFYVVSFLHAANPSVEGLSLAELQAQNREILQYCEDQLGCKTYLHFHNGLSDWKKHFGSQWTRFVDRKRSFDPRAVLAPGQNIFVPRQPVRA